MDAVTDVAAERQLLAAILLDPSGIGDVLSITSPDDLTGMHATILETMVAMTARSIPVDALRVTDELRRTGQSSAIVTLIAGLVHRPEVTAGQAPWIARRVAQVGELRRLHQLGVRVQQAAESPAAEPEQVTDFVTEEIAKHDRVFGTEEDADALQLIARDLSVEWLVPDLLARTDRMILVGHEGHGKSMLLAQIAVMLAAGIHPWTLLDIPPVRVLFIDAENDPPEVSGRLDRLQCACITRGKPLRPGQLTYVEREYGLDLATSTDATWLLRTVAHHRPEVLLIGPMYQLMDGDLAKEEVSAQLKVALNRARARSRCALLMEAHVGHEDHSGRRPIRPYGSSMWRRWAGIGHALVPERDDEKHIIPGQFNLVDYRGKRSMRPAWPSRLMWNRDEDGFPWIDSDADAFYSRVRHWSAS